MFNNVLGVQIRYVNNVNAEGEAIGAYFGTYIEIRSDVNDHELVLVLAHELTHMLDSYYRMKKGNGVEYLSSKLSKRLEKSFNENFLKWLKDNYAEQGNYTRELLAYCTEKQCSLVTESYSKAKSVDEALEWLEDWLDNNLPNVASLLPPPPPRGLPRPPLFK